MNHRLDKERTERLDYRTVEYNYTNLSTDAQYVARKAIREGAFVSSNLSRDSPEFRYTDSRWIYRINWNDSYYYIDSHGGSSRCPIEEQGE